MNIYDNMKFVNEDDPDGENLNLISNVNKVFSYGRGGRLTLAKAFQLLLSFVGIKSSGVHSNGFSLVRKVLLKDAKLDLHQYYEQFGKTLGEELLTPTKIYVKTIKHLLTNKVDIKGMCHITGGGFFENVPRMLKDGQGVEINVKSFPRPKIFDFIKETGNIDEKEMYNVFNMGIGFMLAVDEKDVEDVMNKLKEINEEAYIIGKVTDSGEVDLKW